MADNSPRRDKFASLQASQNTSGQQQQANMPPRRDKFASLAAKQQSQPPRNDKFASLAAQQQQQSSQSDSPPARRDKFSSLASRTNNNKPSASSGRDKFSSLRAQQQQQQLQASPFPAPQQGDSQENQILKGRIQQRQAVLKDLEVAEGLTWQLMQLAAETAQSLTDLQNEDESLSSTTKEYRNTLQRIHGLLSPHASLLVAYQNHQQEEESTNMYAARAEMRLAQERQKVLQEMLRIEQSQVSSSGDEANKKRKLDT